ncbi:alpha-protein kinase 3 isoform X2 [Dendropsophus ebraccatus]|uniref:alpha-protein kinase 3 isoform X2 n=1 Tax=Dendropsophus ebraccatus TaxID=150705 RepID=UPI0038311565
MMGTRRPMNRTPSGNGRYYDSHGSSNGSTSDSEDSNGSVYTPRADSRSYLLNVRPENRTTFCSIISQLTEETQPCFETTLKPRAVSEGSDAKFICMVTGYPEPEVTWYKDDEEMDRYCGLPKYEILRNGKRHTLQIYKCSEEDAAIYQASARNNKGIVSCSGVLEVGTMTEYKIHQRWFAKLKRKAEAKMREIEQSRRKVKENLDESERLRALSPERIQRKRRFSSEKKDSATESIEKEENVKVHVPDPNSRLQDEVTEAKEKPHNVVNGFHAMETEHSEEITTNGYTVPENIEENGKEFLAYVYETVEVITKKSTPKESYAKKKKKEEEPPLNSKDLKDEPKKGIAKKTDGISPPPRRTRFGKDVTKTPVEDKKEVQTPPVTVNKRFAPSIVPNKSAKTTVIKDPKKIKDNILPIKKGDDSSIPKQGHLQNKDNIHFSLKDMYFDDSPSQPEVITPLDQVKKTKNEVQSHNSSEQIKIPKVAPRRSKDQRELSVGRKPPPSPPSPKKERPLTKPVSNLDQNTSASKPNSELPKTVVDNSAGSSTLASAITGDATEQKPKEVKSELLVSSNLSSEVKSQKTSKDESASPSETNEHQAPEKNRISSEDLNEEMTRTETLKKLQTLEVEYMALQKAYALLQKQLELSQKAEEAQKISKCPEKVENHEQAMTDTNKEKKVEIQENTEKEISLMKCPSSPVQVDMETDMPTEIEVIPDSINKIEQTGQSQTNDNMSLDMAMEFSLEEGSNVKQEETHQIDAIKAVSEPVECSLEEGSNEKRGGTHQIDAIKAVSASVECRLEEGSNVKQGGTHQIDAIEAVSEPVEVSREIRDVVRANVPFMAKDISDNSLKEDVVHTSDVEMLEDVKAEVTKETVERQDEPAEEGITVCSSSGTATTLQQLYPAEMEKDVTSSCSVLQDIQTEGIILEIPKEGPSIDLEDSLQLLPSEQNDQSVATLLRDVKKALESGVASHIGSCVDPASLHSSVASPQSDGDNEPERIQIIPQKEDTSSQDLLETETTSTDQKETKGDTNVPSSGLSTTSPQDNHKDEHSTSKQKEKQDHGLVTTLKNSLLMLLHIKTADADKTDEESQRHMGDAHPDSSEEMHSPQMSLSPPSPRKMYESGKDSDSPQSMESMHSSSTSGKLTPTSEDTAQNVDSLQTSPTIPRRILEISKKENIIQQVESAPQSPVTPKRSSKVVTEKTVLSKEDLSFSPATSRRIAAKIASGTDPTVALTVPSIVVGNLPVEKTLGSMLSDPQKDSSRKWRSTENLCLIPSATPEELASGARRKIYLNKTKQLDNEEPGNTGSLTPPSKKESPNVSPGLSRRNNSLSVTQSPPVERRSPGTIRKMAMLEVPKIYEEDIGKESTNSSSQDLKDVGHTSKEGTLPTETKKVNDPYKAPQVIRKIRAEQFSDASGNLKLWCQFFNILSVSNITWFKDEIQVAKIKRSSGDEGQVALAIVQASVKDCGVYQCTIENEYGSDSTDCLLSAEILSGFITKEEVEVGEEIEMTPMVFAKGLADSGYWGDKFFGRIVMEDPHVGNGFLRKSCRVKVIYGLDPMFESGKTSIIKIRNLITFGTKNESTLVEKNYDITIQECKIQNTTREYCKIFAAECRGVPNFGKFPEILPLNLIYRPANNIPYATIEEDLEGRFEKYCIRDLSGKLHMKNSTEIEQKCCTFQHWVFQWTNGNFLVTTLEGVGWTLTNIGIATKSKGYQGLKESCYPEVLDEFLSVHQCNSYCEMLGLKSLKVTEGLQPPSKPKGSRSPQMARKAGSAQSSPQIQKKVMSSPQTGRKGGVSPKSTRKAIETADPPSGSKNKGSEVLTISKSQ